MHARHLLQRCPGHETSHGVTERTQSNKPWSASLQELEAQTSVPGVPCTAENKPLPCHTMLRTTHLVLIEVLRPICHAIHAYKGLNSKQDSRKMQNISQLLKRNK
jgi:hypothetical protein